MQAPNFGIFWLQRVFSFLFLLFCFVEQTFRWKQVTQCDIWGTVVWFRLPTVSVSMYDVGLALPYQTVLHYILMHVNISVRRPVVEEGRNRKFFFCISASIYAIVMKPLWYVGHQNLFILVMSSVSYDVIWTRIVINFKF